MHAPSCCSCCCCCWPDQKASPKLTSSPPKATAKTKEEENITFFFLSFLLSFLSRLLSLLVALARSLQLSQTLTKCWRVTIERLWREWTSTLTSQRTNGEKKGEDEKKKIWFWKMCRLKNDKISLFQFSYWNTQTRENVFVAEYDYCVMCFGLFQLSK